MFPLVGYPGLSSDIENVYSQYEGGYVSNEYSVNPIFASDTGHTILSCSTPSPSKALNSR
jgi:hypothetical protein